MDKARAASNEHKKEGGENLSKSRSLELSQYTACH